MHISLVCSRLTPQHQNPTVAALDPFGCELASGCGPGGGYETHECRKWLSLPVQQMARALEPVLPHVGHSLRKLTVRTPSKHALLLINIKGYFLISVQVCSVCCCVSLAFSLLLSVVFSFTLFPLLFKCLPFNLCSKLGFGNSSKGGGAGDIIVPSEPRGDKVRERQQTISLSFTEQ